MSLDQAQEAIADQKRVYETKIEDMKQQMLLLTSSCDYLKQDLCRSRDQIESERAAESTQMVSCVASGRAIANWRIALHLCRATEVPQHMHTE